MADTSAPEVSLGDRMKAYEAASGGEAVIDSTRPFVIRLDGRKFSTFTRPFNKPFDTRLQEAMVLTAERLMMHFHPVTAYTCSDEITLVFHAIPEGSLEQNNFNGRIMKLATLSASFCSVVFDRELRAQPFDPAQDSKILKTIQTSIPHFDARVISLPNDTEVLNNLIWRCHYDCTRNSVSSLAQAHFTPQQLSRKHKDLQLQMLRDINVDWESLPGHFKYGVFLKRETYAKEVELNGKMVVAERTRVARRSFDITFSEENLRFVMSKGGREKTTIEEGEPSSSVSVTPPPP